MYSVGQDVDTLVSGKGVTPFVCTRLYSGNPVNGNQLEFFQVQAFSNWTIYRVGQSAGKPFSSISGQPALPPHSDHLSKVRPQSDAEFGSYLAGLIEADGYFGDRRLEIVLHSKDIKLAYFLRSKLGYGLIYNIDNRNAIKFVIRKTAGLAKVLALTNGKFVTPFKIQQLLNHKYDILHNPTNLTILPPLNHIHLDSYWLAGFIDGDGSLGIFQAKSLTHRLKTSVRLEVKFSQKESLVLNLIKEVLGGSIHLDKKGITRLNITSMTNLSRIILYLDRYSLQSEKYLQYFIFRRTYRMIEKKEHLTLVGLTKIKQFKERLQQVYK